MERGDGLSPYHHPNPTSGLDKLENPNPKVTCSDLNPNPNRAREKDKMVQPQNQYMPIANIIRSMRRILPAHAKISDDVKETVQECVSEYISFVTGEANDRCQREKRKTISAEDVLWAMNKLGFDDYIEPLTVFLIRYRECESDRGGTLRGELQYKPSGFNGGGRSSIAQPFSYKVLDPSTMMGGYYQN